LTWKPMSRNRAATTTSCPLKPSSFPTWCFLNKKINMTQIDLCTDTLVLVNFIWYKRFSLPPPPSNFSASTFFRMTFHIYIYIYIYSHTNKIL
jgi:hypothetical protein